MFGQLPPRKIAPRLIAPQAITTEDNYPLNNFSPDNCAREKLPPRTIVPEENYPPENCPVTRIFPLLLPLKQIPINECYKWTEENYALSLYEYYNIRVLQLRIKNRFSSIYVLQILTKPSRTPLIREHISLNTSWFSSARTQKIQFFGKSDSE